MTKEKAAVELIMPDGDVFKGRKKDIDQQIISIIGLDAGQFMQVAMIAQGDFMKLLHASSKDRKVIFSKIFRTGMYWRIQEQLKDEAGRFYGQLEDTRKRYLHELSRTVAQTGSDEAKLLTELLEKHYPDADSADELINRICQKDQENYETADARRRLLEQEMTVLQKEAGEIRNREAAAKRYEEAVQNSHDIREQQEKRLEDKEKAADELAACVQRQEEESEVLQSAIYRVKQMISLYDACDGKINSQKKLTVKIEAARKKAEDNACRLESMREQYRQYGEKLSVKTVVSEEILRLTHQKEAYQERLCRLHILLQQMIKREEQEKKCRQILAEHEYADGVYREMNERYERMYHLFMAEQAGILAAALKEEQPCPVCGSFVHPGPASLTEHAPDQQTVNRAREESESAREKRQQYMDSLQHQNGIYQEMQEAVNREGKLLLNEQWQDNAEYIRTLEQQLQEKGKELGEELHKAEEQMQELEQLEKLKAELEKQIELETSGEQKLNEQILQLTQQKMTLDGEISALKGQLVYASRGEAEAVLIENQNKLRLLDQAADDARKNSQKLEKDYEHLSGRLQAALEEETKALQAVEQSRKLIKNTSDDLNLETIDRQLMELTEKKETAENECHEYYAVQAGNESVRDSIKEIRQDYESLNGQYQIRQNLSRTANGSLAGNVKIDLETYVLRYYFKQIIDAANRRLVQMNGRQFILKCTSMENLGSRGEAGLNLDVCSLVTGGIRDVGLFQAANRLWRRCLWHWEWQI